MSRNNCNKKRKVPWKCSTHGTFLYIYADFFHSEQVSPIFSNSSILTDARWGIGFQMTLVNAAIHAEISPIMLNTGNMRDAENFRLHFILGIRFRSVKKMSHAIGIVARCSKITISKIVNINAVHDRTWKFAAATNKHTARTVLISLIGTVSMGSGKLISSIS